MLGNLIKDFPEWGEHTNGIAQYIGKCNPNPFISLFPCMITNLIASVTAWTAFCAEGLGCSLQHYQKGIGEVVAAEWGLPTHWNMRAQLVFGTPDGPPRGGENKQFADIEPRVKVFGAE